ncbi:predicted protein, partial [Nematostella vectensis]
MPVLFLGPPAKPVCQTPIDLAFLVEGSTAVGANFNALMKFTTNMAKNFDISVSATHVGLVLFSTTASVKITLNEFYDIVKLTSAINLITIQGGFTNTGKGLQAVKSDLFDATTRKNVPRVLIVLTVASSLDDVRAPSQALRDNSVTVYVVGVGERVDVEQMNVMGSDPDRDHVF